VLVPFCFNLVVAARRRVPCPGNPTSMPYAAVEFKSGAHGLRTGLIPDITER